MINTIAFAVDLLFRFLEMAIFIEVILSWVYRGGDNAVTNLLHVFTEPFMAPARKLQDKIAPGLMLDFSPIVALFILGLLRSLVYAVLRMF
jgi:YggT family protein